MKKTTRSKSKKSAKVRDRTAASGASADLPVVMAASKRSSGADKDAVYGGHTHLFPFDSKSLAQLAVGSSLVIATLLCLSDGVALIPGATSVISWSLRLIGNWVICAVLWFVGFGALVQLLKLLSRGVIASPLGLKLSRFDRLIHWSDIQAISLEPNAFFTRVFSLKVPARKLTILFRLTEKNKILGSVLFPNFVPSFFFSQETFDALVKTIFEKSRILPAAKLPETLDHDYSIFAFRPEQLVTVANTSRWLTKQRVIVTAIVAITLVVFLGRKAAVNFSYNSGQKAYREGRLDTAAKFYRLSINFDPTFAAAWNALGQCEFHLAETNLTSFDRARKDWTYALICKPDYVEPKLNLVRLALYQRKFAEASYQIERATSIDPQNILAMLEKAELDIRLGKLAAGLKAARLVVSQCQNLSIDAASSIDAAPALVNVRSKAEFAFLAHCLIAQAKLDMKDIAGAVAEIQSYSDDPLSYQSGQNITYMYIVKSRILAAQKQYKEAEKLALAAVGRQPRNEEALAQVAQLEVDLGNYPRASQYLGAARALLVADPWLSIIYGRQLLKESRVKEAVAAFADALIVQDANQDAFALAAVNRDLAALVEEPAVNDTGHNVQADNKQANNDQTKNDQAKNEQANNELTYQCKQLMEESQSRAKMISAEIF